MTQIAVQEEQGVVEAQLIQLKKERRVLIGITGNICVLTY